MLHLIWYVIVGFLAAASLKRFYIPIFLLPGQSCLNCGLNYRRRCDSFIFPAKWRRPIPSGRLNRFHTWGCSGFISLAQIQTTLPRG